MLTLFLFAAREAQSTRMGKHPEIKEQLAYIHYMVDRLTSTQKRDLWAAGKEIPPTPEPPTDFEIDEEDQDEMESQTIQGENKGKDKEIADVGEVAEPSNKEKEAAYPAEYEHIEVTSSEIFVGCESIGKI